MKNNMKTRAAWVLVGLLMVGTVGVASAADKGGKRSGMPNDSVHGQAQSHQSHQSHESQASALSPEEALVKFKNTASAIDTSVIATLPVQNHGRIKPMDSLAREAILYLTGKYSQWGLGAIQIYFGLMLSNATPDLEVINIRDPNLRIQLGFSKGQRLFSLHQLQGSRLEEMARPVFAKQEQNEKLVSPEERNILEVMQQVWLLRSIMGGDQFFQAVVLDVKGAPGQQVPATSGGPVFEKAQGYLQALSVGERSSAEAAARELISVVRSQPMPELFRRYLDKLGLEVWYNHAHLFFISGALYFLIGLVLAFGLLLKVIQKKKNMRIFFWVLAIPLVMHVCGFVVRVYITGFSPVTNMYGTMIWMALGVALFGSLLFALYRQQTVYGLLMIGAGVTLILTESIPLVLSPDMDPIVAVLRNNFWLSVHVLTITISYAALTIAMLIGNAALVKTLVGKPTEAFIKTYAHLTYRTIQLGVFLLTTGIILGGWWADYSWGRFWGWDPKETWSLIADLGFLAILHAKYVGWLSGFGLLAAAPLAYLLVIMAWYGVNFILAAGLHSYGFSSGGATMVVVFVSFQVILFVGAMVMRQMRGKRVRLASKTG